MNYPQLVVIPDYYLKNKLNEFLLEDAPQGDLTTSSVVEDPKEITAQVIAEEEIVFAGVKVIQTIFESFELKVFLTDGEKAEKGKVLAEIKGLSDKILLRERVMLNLLQRICGIATLTRKYVEIANPYNVQILDTRKTTPGLRFFEKFAVCAGGGTNHRLDLSSGILIKDNHIKAAGSITKALENLRRSGFDIPVEVEVENISDITEALEAEVDGILLDNMSPSEVVKCVEYIRANPKGKEVFIEASGGINLSNLADYVVTGINAVSVGALTHSYKSSEIHLEII